jgi:exodeoxyribonuclease III
MKIISWNVNGLRAILNKGLLKFIADEKPDMICLQEIKSIEIQIGLLGYNMYWNPAKKPGYAGTATFTKQKPLNVTKMEDDEGRVLTLEFEHNYLVNVYVPNSGRGLPRLPYRREWNRKFISYLAVLQEKKPIIVCGDLNCAHKEIDIARPKQNQKTAGFTPEEREDFDALLSIGLVDSFRQKHPDKIKYSWWSYMFNARAKNIGWRIDYFLVSERISRKVTDADILDQIKGSDHCPVELVIG